MRIKTSSVKIRWIQIKPSITRIKICAVKIDNWKNPSKTLSVKEFVINANSPKILYIPGGYAHGTQNLKADSKLMVFSTFSLEQTIKDDYRFKSDLWYDWNIQFR